VGVTATSWQLKANQFFRKFFNTILPPACVGCGRPGEIYCQACVDRTSVVAPPFCDTCGHSTHRPVFRCKNCHPDPRFLSQIRTPYYHAQPLAKAIHTFKYQGAFALSATFAKHLADHWPVWRVPPDVLVPIPLHPVRERERGYNQATLLAEALGTQISLPVDKTMLVRIRDTPPQVGLGFQERQKNVAGAFQARHEVDDGRHYLLIDDVLTTGATLSAAAAALHGAGALSVSGYCLARARRDS